MSVDKQCVCEVDLCAMTKEELKAFADKHHIIYSPTPTKYDLVLLLEELGFSRED